jgi:hypothetical protein
VEPIPRYRRRQLLNPDILYVMKILPIGYTKFRYGRLVVPFWLFNLFKSELKGIR